MVRNYNLLVMCKNDNKQMEVNKFNKNYNFMIWDLRSKSIVPMFLKWAEISSAFNNIFKPTRI